MMSSKIGKSSGEKNRKGRKINFSIVDYILQCIVVKRLAAGNWILISLMIVMNFCSVHWKIKLQLYKAYVWRMHPMDLRLVLGILQTKKFALKVSHWMKKPRITNIFVFMIAVILYHKKIKLHTFHIFMSIFPRLIKSSPAFNTLFYNQ